MSSSPHGHITEAHIKQSYIDPIRSVILIDDQFPSYEQLSIQNTSAGRWDIPRAVELWNFYRKKKWSCQIESSYNSSVHEYVTNHDLIILDYHLINDSYEPALKLLRKLANEPRPHFVVLYTAEAKLPLVLRIIAIYLRGVEELDSIFGANRELQDLWNDNNSTIIDLANTELIDLYLRGQSLTASPSYKNLRMEIMRVLMKLGRKDLFQHFCQAATETILRNCLSQGMLLGAKSDPSYPVRMSAEGNSKHLWIWRDNLFVTLVSKETDTSGEGDRIVTQLTNSLLDAAPSPLELTLAFARDAIHKAGFCTELNFVREQHRQAGWWYHVLSAPPEDKEERIANLANCLLTDMMQLESIVEQVRGFCSALLAHSQGSQSDTFTLAKKLSKCAEDTKKEVILHALNEFLCSEPFSGNSIRTGTILQEVGAQNPNQYLICVSPACDMVARMPRKGWLKQLHPIKPFSVIVAVSKPISPGSFDSAEQGRELFITDKNRMVIEAISSDARQPALEVLFAENSARLDEDRTVSVKRIVLEKKSGQPSFKSITCRVVGQLRSPYANRLLHATGSHLSRVGVDFLQDRPSDSQSSDGEK